ncbi:MAG: helix-hairpin-helix domain-containing protein [Myxococcales bacterium]|nr:MAG: helix-hairpin-helix domain-containing protein [Myxococcales bacterium]
MFHRKTISGIFLSIALASPVVAPSKSFAEKKEEVQAPQSPQPTDSLEINLNTATLKELMLLPGIGPAKAEAIIKLRDKRKSFKKIHEILRVKGIGRKTLKRLQPMLKLSGENHVPKANKEKRKTAQEKS